MESYVSAMSPSMSDPTSRTIIIEDVPESHEESLEDFLENRKKGGGRKELFERHRLNSKNMVAVFAHSAGSSSLCLDSVIVRIIVIIYITPLKDKLNRGRSVH